MYYNRSKRKTKMCYQDKDKMDPGEFSESYEDDNTGGKVKVTRFSDGTSITHHGGPCGPTRHDEFGNEC